MLATLLLTAAALACAGPSAAASPVAYTVTPVVRGDALDHLAVELRFCGDADGETRLSLPNEWAGTSELWRSLAGLTVDGAESVAPDGPAARRIVHRPLAPLVVRYRVAASDTADPGAAFAKARPVVRPGWFFFHGEGTFAAPDGRDDAPARFAWGALPRGWRVASDLDHVAARGAGAVRDVVESVAIGAPDLRVAERVIDGAPVRVAMRGAFADSPDSLAAMISRVVVAQHRYWGDPVRPFVVPVAPLVPVEGGGRSIHGTGRGDAFSIAATTNARLADERRFLAHELMHSWIAGEIGGLAATDEALGYWMSEGFTEFLAARVLLRSGLWTLEQFAADLDATVRRLALSPVGSAPNRTIAERFWTDPAVGRLPYDRGHVVAHLLDHRVRARSGGRAGLDDLLRAQRAIAARRRAEGVRTSATALLPAALRETLGAGARDVEAEIARHVEAGEAVVLPADLFGRCARIVSDSVPVFERGFDVAATQAAGGVATGVDPSGAAWAAGLRDGMRILRREAGTPGDATVPYALRVATADGERVIRYLPAGARRVATQRVVLAELSAAERAGCVRRMSGGG